MQHLPGRSSCLATTYWQSLKQLLCGMQVAALEALASSGATVRLRDYGVHAGRVWLVLQRCTCNLKHWRDRRPPGCTPRDLGLYLHAFRLVRVVHAAHV